MKKKDYTVNVDIQILAKNEKEIYQKLSKILKDVNYWIGNIDKN